MMQLTTLDNGLRVASRTMDGLETVAVGLYAEAGSRHEPARLNGIAHLFEHMVFKGAGSRSAGARSPGATKQGRPAGAISPPAAPVDWKGRACRSTWAGRS